MNKNRSDELIDIWFDVLMSSSNDAGWHSCGLLEKLKMPHVIGRSDLKDNKMISEVRFLEEKPQEFHLIDKALEKLRDYDSKAWLAVLSNRFYRHCYLDPVDLVSKPYRDVNRAAAIGQTPRQFAKNKQKGYIYLNEVIELIEIGLLIKNNT